MWMDLGIVALFIAAGYALSLLIGWRTRVQTRNPGRGAEDLYDVFAGSPRASKKVNRTLP